MLRTLLAPFLFSAASLTAAETPFTGGKWIDLTHDLSADTIDYELFQDDF